MTLKCLGLCVRETERGREREKERERERECVCMFECVMGDGSQ